MMMVMVIRPLAIAAAVGVGTFADLSEGAAAMTAAARNYQPDNAISPAYDRRYRVFGEINQVMTPIWQRIAAEQAKN